MTKEILFKFAEKGINLSPEAYSKIITLENPLKFVSSLILKLKIRFSRKELIILSGDIVDEYLTEFGLNLPKSQNKDSNHSLNELMENKEKTITENTLQGDYKENMNQLSPMTKNSSENRQNLLNKTNKTKNQDLNTQNKNLKKTPNEYRDNDRTSPKNSFKKFNNDNTTESIHKSLSTAGASESITKTVNSIENINKSMNNVDTIENVNNNGNSIGNAPKQVNINESKRNQELSNIEFDYKVIQDTSKKSYTSGEISNLISYFKNRYDKLSNILSKHPELRTYHKIADINSNSGLTVIGMIKNIVTTKNNHRIIEIEDDTGEVSTLIHNENDVLMRESEKLVKDEVIGLIGDKKGDLAIASKIIQPGFHRIAEKNMDFSIAFTSDIHIGSLTFLEQAFVNFTDWLNGDYGNEDHTEIANDVKYLIIAGDIVDGIGVYPNQDKELAIKDITEQYDEAARLLGNIRSDVKIIIGPGNHDASRVAEPQPAVPEKYASSLYKLKNVEFVSNPAIVNLEGIEVLIYHGRGIDDMAMNVKGMSHEKNDLIMEELLKKRHLAPLYGERTPLASELEDHLVVDKVPDVFHTGHVHINTYKKLNGVHMINSGTFQTQTEFQKIYNIVPTCAEVPILYKGMYKQLKFID
jgi:DNA polymerase II small subunit